MCLVVALGLIVPRLTLAVLWFFTPWTAVLRPWWLAMLGFFFAPFTTLAYVLVHHWSGSVETSAAHMIILAIALAMDLGSWGGARGGNRKKT